MRNKILNILSEIAIDIIPVSKARISSAIVYKNEIISIGTNKYKTDPLQLKFNQNYNNKKIYIHAEIDAIKKSLHYISIDKLKRCDIYVCRIKKVNGKWINALAKPCKGCTAAILNYEISNIIYTIEGPIISYDKISV